MSRLKMRNKFFISLLFLLTVYVYGNDGYYSDPYDLTDLNIQEDFVGTYLPVDYEKFLTEYKSHEKALRKIKKEQYTVLFLKKDICRSDLAYLDGFAIQTDIVKKWKFTTENEFKMIIDENGYKYRKLSDRLFAYNEIAENAMQVILGNYQSNDFSVEKNYLRIKDIKYKFVLRPTYTDEDMAFAVYYKNLYFVILDDNSIKLVGSKRVNAMQFDPTDEIIYECKKK